jgi:hypothetical protein
MCKGQKTYELQSEAEVLERAEAAYVLHVFRR